MQYSDFFQYYVKVLKTGFYVLSQLLQLPFLSVENRLFLTELYKHFLQRCIDGV